MKLSAILNQARKQGASDVHLISGLSPAFRINGEIIFSPEEPLSRDQCRELIESLLNENQKKHLEETRELCFSTHDILGGRTRVTIYFHGGSPEMCLRLCCTEIPTAEELGLPSIIDEFARKSGGMIIVTGPTGVGKTTTLNYMIDLINRERRCKIITIEDPIEFIHRPQKAIVIQQEVHTDCLSFALALRHVLRQDPDIIVIGEMRDLDTISTALTAAETGHLVLATLHTPNVYQTVERIVGAFPPYQQQQIQLQLSNCLRGVVAQDLLPLAGGEGRVLAYELMVTTDAIRNMIRENNLHQINNYLQTGSKHGMVLMENTLLRLYQEGKITYDMALSKARNPGLITKKG